MIRVNVKRGYTLIELAVTIAIIALILGILLPVLLAARRTARSMQNNTQSRGIHQALVMYAQGNGGYYPGLDPDGQIIDATIEYRFQQLLEGNYFTGEYVISLSETKTPWNTGPVTSEHYSYAMLDIDAVPGGRFNEWRDTLNSQAPVLSDRNIGSDATANSQSVHTDTSVDWRGAVAYNDNSTAFETTHVLPTGFTVFDEDGNASILQHQADNLFVSDSPDDALMIHSGQ